MFELADGGTILLDDASVTPIAELECAEVVRAMAENRHNKMEAACPLGISRPALYRPAREIRRRAESTGSGPSARLAVIAELERDAEVMLAQQAHRVLKIIFRGRRYPNLISLYRRLYLFQLSFLQELDDFLGGVRRDALLQ